MKARVLLAGAAVLIAASATTAMAAGPYVGVSAGLAIVHDSDVDVPGFGSGEVSYDMGYGLNLSAGYGMDPFRGELEFGYKTADLEDVDESLDVMSYMVNGYYDFKTSNSFNPFVGAGLGFINADIDDTDDTVFGYQLTAGIAMNIAPNLNLDLAYRYQSTFGDLDLDGVDVSYDSSNITAGIRYNF